MQQQLAVGALMLSQSQDAGLSCLLRWAVLCLAWSGSVNVVQQCVHETCCTTALQLTTYQTQLQGGAAPWTALLLQHKPGLMLCVACTAPCFMPSPCVSAL
jgi:hypothetical protein